MSAITQPRAGIPIGFTRVNGKDLPVTITDEWLRYFEAVMQRIGGVRSISQDELAMMMPGPAPQPVQDAAPVIDAATQALIAQVAEDAARMQVQALIPQEPAPDNAAQVAALAEEVFMSRRPRRVISGSIALTSTSGTYTVSPAITGIAELRLTGITTDGTSLPAIMTGISLSGSTVTATRYSSGPGVTTTVYFEISEYP